MAIIAQKSLFRWEEISELGDLERLLLVLKHLPDEALMRLLEDERSKGRDDYPIRPVWNSILAGIVYQHPTANALRRELMRNAQLRELCGFDPLKGIEAVPPSWVYTRFLKKLMKHIDRIEAIFDGLVEVLRTWLPGFGCILAIDGKAIRSHARPGEKDAPPKPPDGRRDVDADHDIKPVIAIRDSWQDDDTSKRVSGTRNVVYDYRGEVYCCCMRTGEIRPMAYGGFEKDRGTLKYRCPAWHYGIECKSAGSCPVRKTVRIPLSEDRRIFTPLARSSYGWRRIYKKRAAVERVNSRLDVSFGFERHFIRGLKKMRLRCGLALMVMLTMALGRVKEKQKKKLRSLVKAA